MWTGRQSESLIPRPECGIVPHFLHLCPPGRQLTYTYPLVYDHKLDEAFAQQVPSLEKVVNGQHVLQSPWNSSVTLTSKAGDTFQSFAKFGKFGDGESGDGGLPNSFSAEGLSSVSLAEGKSGIGTRTLWEPQSNVGRQPTDLVHILVSGYVVCDLTRASV